ncbi:DUF4097 family beta strand repeat-containing protein [Actinopolymorpha alba]|uniref:DUF4097 family beta strand repeat-containing protein n=1 Tax=Actinopolymorpha alba TaxID=533267 RepID=UPI00037C39CD|nr:DUF4097 family beta strand repeat-containing protein [Actinopolymorpha alba]
MPTFATPEPISLRVKLASGDLTIDASARNETEVEVRPGNPNKSVDVEAAANTLVEHRDGTIVIEAPEDRDRTRWFGSTPSLHIRVALPKGSHLRGSTASADVRATGRLGDVEVNTASGDLRLEEAAALTAQTASGDVIGRQIVGDAKVQTASGDVSIREIHGQAMVSTASGDVQLGQVHSLLRLQTASGDATVDAAHDSVETTTASGDVRIGSVQRGQVAANGASGDIRIGVQKGTAAWLDVSSLSGDVRSALDEADQPGDTEETVEIRARTLSGDITISRAR